MTDAQTKWHFPRRAKIDNKGRIVQVLSYDGEGMFTVLRSNGTSEEKVFVRRDRLTFIPDRKKGGN